MNTSQYFSFNFKMAAKFPAKHQLFTSNLETTVREILLSFSDEPFFIQGAKITNFQGLKSQEGEL